VLDGYSWEVLAFISSFGVALVILIFYSVCCSKIWDLQGDEDLDRSLPGYNTM
jgi:hypothetical protein